MIDVIVDKLSEVKKLNAKTTLVIPDNVSIIQWNGIKSFYY